MSRALLVRDPAAATAAARCLNARIRDRDRWLTRDHPSRCGWCDYPQTVLADMIADFHRWSGYDDRRRTYAHHELRVWSELKAADQRDLVLAAQGLEDEPPPAPGRPASIAEVPPLPPAPVAPVTPELGREPATSTRPSWAGGRS